MVSMVVKAVLVMTAPKVTLGPRVRWDLQDSVVKRETKVKMVQLVKRAVKVRDNFADFLNS